MILRQRVIPVVILLALLPKSFYYLFRVDKYPYSSIWFIILFTISGIYIVYRFILVSKIEQSGKRLILSIFDTLILSIGILLASYFEVRSLKYNHFFIYSAAIPFFVSNYIVLNTALKHNNL